MSMVYCVSHFVKHECVWLPEYLDCFSLTRVLPAKNTVPLALVLASPLIVVTFLLLTEMNKLFYMLYK